MVQIVDGRHPLFYRCEDFEQYAKEIDASKINLMLINKADLVDESVRNLWSKWFIKNNVQHLYFSAKEEQEKLDEDIIEKDELEEENIINEYMNTSKVINLQNFMIVIKSLVKNYRKTRTEIKKKGENLEKTKIESTNNAEIIKIESKEIEKKSEISKTDIKKREEDMTEEEKKIELMMEEFNKKEEEKNKLKEIEVVSKNIDNTSD